MPRTTCRFGDVGMITGPTRYESPKLVSKRSRSRMLPTRRKIKPRLTAMKSQRPKRPQRPSRVNGRPRQAIEREKGDYAIRKSDQGVTRPSQPALQTEPDSRPASTAGRRKPGSTGQSNRMAKALGTRL